MEAISRLAHSPRIGRVVAANMRELVSVPPYLIRYRVGTDLVEVVRIRHAARRPSQ